MKRATGTAQTPDGDTLPASAPAGERRPGLRAAGLAASRLAAPIVAARGGGVLARLKAEWPAVAGAETAAATWPTALGRGGVLRLLVAPAQALELQHRTPLLIERINLFFGRPAVTRIALVQGPLPLPPERPRPVSEPPSPQETAGLERQVAAVADTELRAALIGLGRAVIAADRRRR